MDDNKDWLSCFGVIVIALASVFFGAMVGGWVLSIVWTWFVIPLFPMAPILTIPQAIGFSLVTGMLAGNNSDSDNKERTLGETITRLLAVAFGRPLFILLLAYIIKSFL